MLYTKGDTPAAPLIVAPARDGDYVELNLYDQALAVLTWPDGTFSPATADLLGDDVEDGPAVAITLPTLAQAGVVEVSLTLKNTTSGKRDTFTLESLCVQQQDGWHTCASARIEWKGAAEISDVRLFVLLDVARRDCIEYQPDAGTRRPTVGEREAQLKHARNRNAAARIDPASGDDGMDGYSAGPFPMDWVVKALLRPARRFGAIR